MICCVNCVFKEDFGMFRFVSVWLTKSWWGAIPRIICSKRAVFMRSLVERSIMSPIIMIGIALDDD